MPEASALLNFMEFIKRDIGGFIVFLISKTDSVIWRYSELS